MWFNPYLNKQAQELTFSRPMAKSYHSQICYTNILGIYLNEKLNFYYHIWVRNANINARNRCHWKAISKLPQHSFIKTFVATHISLSLGTNGKPLTAIDKFPKAIGKLLRNGVEITNTMIGNGELEIYWQSLVNWLCKPLDQICNDC